MNFISSDDNIFANQVFDWYVTQSLNADCGCGKIAQSLEVLNQMYWRIQGQVNLTEGEGFLQIERVLEFIFDFVIFVFGCKWLNLLRSVFFDKNLGLVSKNEQFDFILAPPYLNAKKVFGSG